MVLFIESWMDRSSRHSNLPSSNDCRSLIFIAMRSIGHFYGHHDKINISNIYIVNNSFVIVGKFCLARHSFWLCMTNLASPCIIYYILWQSRNIKAKYTLKMLKASPFIGQISFRIGEHLAHVNITLGIKKFIPLKSAFSWPSCQI